jgi:hypothetical protein
MSKLFDRVKETTTTTGTGNITLAGAAVQYVAFSSVYSVGDDQISYAIVGQTGSEWEVGLGTYVSSNTLQRDLIYFSSNANAAVNFSAGTKDVWVNLSSIEAYSLGRMTAMARGMALP